MKGCRSPGCVVVWPISKNQLSSLSLSLLHQIKSGFQMAAEDFHCVITWNKEFYPFISEPHIRVIFDVTPGGGITRVLIFQRRALVFYRNPAAGLCAIRLMLADGRKRFGRLFEARKLLCNMSIRALPHCDYCEIDGHHISRCIQVRQPVHYLFRREIQGRDRLGSRRKCALLNLTVRD